MSALVMNVEDSFIEIARIEEDTLKETGTFPFGDFSFVKALKDNDKKCVVACEDDALFKTLEKALPTLSLERVKQCKMAIPAATSSLSENRLVKLLGALSCFPINECLVVDMGEEAIVFDYIDRKGHYKGGARFIYPQKMLRSTEKAIGESSQEEQESGLYFGILGAIERIIAEITQASPDRSCMKVVATGKLLYQKEEDVRLTQAVSELVDKTEPRLALLGLKEIIKEQKLKSPNSE